MKKFSRKLFLFIALFIGLQSNAQTEYEYYDRIPTVDEEGNPQYDTDSHSAWITTVDSKEWKFPVDEPVATGPNGQFRFGSSSYTDGSANSGQVWGTVYSPNFDVDGSLTLDLTFNVSNHAAQKNNPQISFHITYKKANGDKDSTDVTITLDLINYQHTINPSGTAEINMAETNHYTIRVPLPAECASDAHIMMSLKAHGGLEVGAGSDGENKIDVYGDNLVLRDDWDNAERLRRNAGTKMKKVTIVRPYDKGWYTLSLPFDLTMKQFQRRFMAGFSKETALANGYTWKEETSAEIWEHTYFTPDSKVMHFEKKYSAGEDAAVLSAGVPYLIYIPNSITNTLFDFTRPGEGPDSEDFSSSDKVMVFTNITLASEAVLTGSASTVEKETGYKFVSNLSKTNLSDVIAANQIYYLGMDGENPVLKKPSSASTNIMGFRAYFVSPKAAEAKPFLSFMNEVPNSIGAVETQFNTDERVYNMQGQYVGKSLNDLPRGIYVVNHKKYVIK